VPQPLQAGLRVQPKPRPKDERRYRIMNPRTSMPNFGE
jgi:hypothetical protein